MTTITAGSQVAVFRSNEWMDGTVRTIADDGVTVRVAVAGDDHIPVRTRTTTYTDIIGSATITADQTAADLDEWEWTDTGSHDTGSQVATTEIDSGGWITETMDDGSRILTNPFGRTVFVDASDRVAVNGIVTGDSFLTRGVQGDRTIARTAVDGSPWVLGCTEDTTGTATCQVCAETTSVRRFPTDGRNRIAVHRACNSARLAGTGNSSRGRGNMAN